MKRIGILILAIGCSLFAQTAQAIEWATIQRLTWTAGVTECPAIAVNAAGHLHMVWHDNTTGNYEIYYRKSVNGGATWTAIKRLTSTAGVSKNPAIAVDPSGYLHVVWQDSTPGIPEIYYKKSTDGGNTWTATIRLIWTSGISENPAIAVNAAGHLHLVWQDSTPGNYEIYYKKSVNGGATWAANQRLTSMSGDSKNPAIAIDPSGYLHVVWQDSTSGNAEIYYKKSTTGGTSWTAYKRLIWTSGISEYPAIAVNSAGHLHLAWHDNTPGNYEIYYKKSVNAGDTWAANQRLTSTAGISKNPAVAVDHSDYLHVVWHDNTTGNPEVYYRTSTNGGATWAASLRLSSTAGSSLDPAIAADPSDNLHVLCDDDTTGNKEIYYKKGSAVSTTPITAYSAYDNTVCYSSADGAVANTVYWGTELGVGWDWFWSMIGYDFIYRASALKFNVQSQISGRSVKKATLRIYVYSLRGDFSVTPQIIMNAFAGDWNPSTLTYNIFETMLIYTDGQVAKDAPVSGVLPFDFDVTYIVNKWASGAWPNYGFALRPSDSQYPGGPSLQGTLFQSLEYYYNTNQRPQLLIEFQ